MSLLLPQFATIKRASYSLDAQYERIPSWSTAASGVPCNIQAKGTQVVQLAQGRTITYNAVGYFAADVDLRPQVDDAASPDRVEVGSAVYVVLAVEDATAGRAKFLKAYLRCNFASA